ncbi:hypothetical protein BDZ89DRAFT_1076153 [Hymenopellis radicata]|nr:hypothetical protein BDZ89DRAFT_1076153 [Hymenopellis radicata]
MLYPLLRICSVTSTAIYPSLTVCASFSSVSSLCLSPLVYPLFLLPDYAYRFRPDLSFVCGSFKRPVVLCTYSIRKLVPGLEVAEADSETSGCPKQVKL